MSYCSNDERTPILLNDGKTIPKVGLGTSPLNDEEVAPVVIAAMEAGYRQGIKTTQQGN